MKYTHCTMSDLQRALEKVNEKYEGNIAFNRLDTRGFTLRVTDSKGPGHRLGFPPYKGSGMGNDWDKRKRMVSACWHVHGDFFDALFEINYNARITSRGKTIDSGQGNWEDFDIGSIMCPYYASEACECNTD